MRTLRLALAQMNPTVGDLEGNARKIVDLTRRARSAGAHVVAFPEMAIPGYPVEDLVFKPSFLRDNVDAMRRVVAASEGIAVAVGFVDAGPEVYNACAVAHDGKLAGIYRKIHLPTYGVFDEDRYFQPGDACPVFVINGVRVGVSICEDLWYPVGPLDVLRQAGAEVVVNINASPYHMGKGAEREALVSARASDNRVWLAYVNMVGGQDELVFDGGSLLVDPTGGLAARGPSFAEDLIVTEVDADAVSRHRLEDPIRPTGDPDALEKIGRPQVVDVSPYRDPPGPPPAPAPRVQPPGAWEEVYGALVLGTRDYVAKSGFSRVLIGLSGGIDSALTAAVAVDALGRENVMGVSMPSRYSSEGSVADSKVLAARLGMELWVVPIEPAHTAFLDMLEPHFRGTAPNLAEENVQARIRGNLLMTMANKFGWLVLTTGNKSETAMGYATLYGDMAGGFAVIKDVPKTLVYDLSRWRNEHGTPRDVIPQAVLEKPPSAELKPDQTDQDTLPPYELLDPIVKAYVEDDLGLQEIADMGFDRELVKGIITAIDRNEYKRRQAPPGIKITPRAFGKDRRLPIVNRYRQL
ncbi:MAG: NAD+ synthase [Dehalococcoidia bacterium]|nr:NAD+ synthase [Dehalococcoidia bacterium]